MKTLIEVLRKNSHKISFHTPGHNNTLPKEIIKFDVTELSYSDNLFNANGVLKNLEQKISDIYQSKKAFISTNGATNCILTAIYAVKDKGSFLIVGKAHRSIYNAVRLTKNKAYYVDKITDDNLCEIPKDVKTVLITSPDYYGSCLDLKFYQDITRKNNMTLIIDSSHGSHFVFSSKLPVSASKYGDLVIMSSHKTLPVPTGGAVLLCNNMKLMEACSHSRKLFHSSSPSYMILYGFDQAYSIFLKQGQKLYDKIYNEIERFKKLDLGSFYCLQNDDFTRLVIAGVWQGEQVSQKLFESGFAIEMSYQNKIVAIVTPYNYKHLKKLAKVLKTISQSNLIKYQIDIKEESPVVIKQLYFGGESELVDLDKAEGKRAYSEIGVYPPGVAIVRSGEIITKKAITIIKENADHCFGLENNAVTVLLYNNGGNDEEFHNNRRL